MGKLLSVQGYKGLGFSVLWIVLCWLGFILRKLCGMGLCNLRPVGRLQPCGFSNHELRYRVWRTHVGDAIDIIAEEL